MAFIKVFMLLLVAKILVSTAERDKEIKTYKREEEPEEYMEPGIPKPSSDDEASSKRDVQELGIPQPGKKDIGKNSEKKLVIPYQEKEDAISSKRSNNNPLDEEEKDLMAESVENQGDLQARMQVAEEVDGIPLNQIDSELNEEMRAERNIYSELKNQLDLYLRGKKGGKKGKKKGGSKGSGQNDAGGKDSGSSSGPVSVGMDMEILKNSHPGKRLRAGQASTTDGCDKITSVPKELRSPANLYPNGIPAFYTKYTHAYGIPILGSSDVDDEGLRRACYLVRLMLASRYDLRNAYYKMHGRVALIGDREQTTSLPEYSTWPKTWDSRTRGVGPTTHIPLSSAGCDNMCCKPGDRYFDQDILLHEFAHGVHQLGASYVIPGFEKRLQGLFVGTVQKAGKWKDTYAATNRHEYFATAAQFYFNVWRSPGKYKSAYGVVDRATLKKYDPKIYALLDEIFPCSMTGNQVIQRCDWKKCDLGNFERVYDVSYKASTGCREVKLVSVKDSTGCANAACYYEGNAYNYRGTTCKVVKCDTADLKISQSKGAYEVYKGKVLPKLDLAQEKKQSLKYECTKGLNLPGMCDGANRNNKCGDSSTTEQLCLKRGCCWVGKTCYYGKQVCVNNIMQCPELAKRGDCERNPGFMYRICPLACDICNQVSKLNEADLLKLCQDMEPHCAVWAEKGECTRNPSFMKQKCKISCKVCSTPKNPLGK